MTVTYLSMGAGGHGDGALRVVDDAVPGQEAGQLDAPGPHLAAHLGHAGLHPEHPVAAPGAELLQVGQRVTGLLLPPPLSGVSGPPLDMEGDRAPVPLVVHQDVQRTLVVLQDILPGGAPTHHLALAPIIRHAQVGLHQTEGRGLASVDGVLVQHLLHHAAGRVVHRQQQRLVGHVLPQGLAVYLERAPGVRAAVLGPELLQLLLELLLPPPPHHRLGVGDAPREARVRQF